MMMGKDAVNRMEFHAADCVPLGENNVKAMISLCFWPL